MEVDEISKQIVDAAISIHKTLGPGLLESAYVAALEIECLSRNMSFLREVPVSASYKGRPLGVVYRADLLVMDKVLVEVKSVQSIEPVHMAQLLSYLRLGNWRVGLLLNFNTPLMKNGIKRIAN
jgi:GxxExxY protein